MSGLGDVAVFVNLELHSPEFEFWPKAVFDCIARDENQHLVLTQNILNYWKKGDDPEMKKIMKLLKKMPRELEFKLESVLVDYHQ